MSDTAVLGHRLHAPHLVAAFALLGASIALAASTGAPWWLVAAGVIGPDLSFLAAIGAPPPARPGLMPPRVVPVYNAVHHWAGPTLLAAAAVALGSTPLVVLAVSWASHLAWDRGVGYSLREADGSMRTGIER
jgi:Domain of unknown function (DUF4260)